MKYSILVTPWRLTHLLLLLTLDYYKTRPLKLNSLIIFLFIQAGFMSSITLMFLFLHESLKYKLRNIKTIRRRKQYRSRKMSRSKERSTVVTENKTVMAFLLGKLAQLFYLAHSFAFFLGKIHLSEQQQNWYHRSQCVYAG